MARHEDKRGEEDITAQLQPLVDDDNFLTSLSRGEDPSGGDDELAQLFLELRGDVERQMPPAPVVEGVEADSNVIALGASRRNWRANPWVAGLVGAAAATVIVAGSGAALYNVEQDSPLWPVSAALYGDRAAVVELAGTLEEMQSAAESGDDVRTRELLDEARSLVASMNEKSDTGRDATPRRGGESRLTVTQTPEAPQPPVVPGSGPAGTATATSTVEGAPAARPSETRRSGSAAATTTQVESREVNVTVTETVTAPVSSQAPSVVTETQVATVTVTVPVVAPAPAPMEPAPQEPAPQVPVQPEAPVPDPVVGDAGDAGAAE